MTETAAKQAARFLKSTLRLPSSTFPPRPSPADLARYLPRCTSELYAWQRHREHAPAAASASSSDSFTLHDGPPYANGDLHVGHALNKIVKDIICRVQLAGGKRVSYVPGWDCHGLPIELKALEKRGGGERDPGNAVTVRRAARQFARDAVRRQMADFRSWAIMADWDGHWKTMDREFELRQLAVFRAMVEKGLVYRRHKPVFWSPSSRTALAEAEVEYRDDFVSRSAIVKFPTNIRAPVGVEGGTVHAVVWTTTPWTLPANQAIAINDGIQYSLVRSRQHGLLIVARSRLDYLNEHIQEEVEVVEESFPVHSIAGTTYNGLAEFGEDAKARPIVHADFVTDSSGTGLVHCAPGHGNDDFEALQPLIETGHVLVKAPVDNTGKFTDAAAPENPSLLAGLYVYREGTQAVLDLMENNGFLLSAFEFKHKYTIDWRTKEPVMIRATAQWFADVSGIRDAALASLDAVQFKPNTGSSRLRSFVANRSEWCISRQRAWGVPIPALYHKDTGEAVLTPQSIDHIISAIKERGIDAWWSDPVDEPAWMPEGLTVSEYERGTDTMDVWFDSGTSWMSMLESHASSPRPLADVYVEGSDQHRGWFQSSLLTRIAYQQAMSPDEPARSPFQTLITHGFTLDANGRKMSKSEGNVIAPDGIIAGLTPASQSAQPKTSKKHRQVHPLGPDALRLWAASSDWTRDVVVSNTVVTSVHNNLDKFRVTLKLLLGMLRDFRPESTVTPYEKMSHLDQIALLQLYRTGTAVRQNLSEFEFHKAISSINRWIASDLSGFYFEALKDVIYCDSVQSLRRQSAQTALFYIFQQLQHMLGAIAPLLIEESFEHSPEAIRQVAQHPLQRIWSPLRSEWDDESVAQAMPLVMSINSAVKAAQEKARADKVMGQSLGSEVLVWLQGRQSLEPITHDIFKEILVVSGFEQRSPNEVSHESIEALKQLASGQGSTEKSSLRDILAKESADSEWSYAYEIEGLDREVLGFVIVRNPSQDKCARCWKYEAPVQTEQRSEEAEHLPLCERCKGVVSEYNSNEEDGTDRLG